MSINFRELFESFNGADDQKEMFIYSVSRVFHEVLNPLSEKEKLQKIEAIIVAYDISRRDKKTEVDIHRRIT